MIRIYGAGVREVADLLRTILDDPEAEKALVVLRRDFTAHNGLGPRRVAQFLTGTADDTIQADVVGYVDALLRALDQESP